MRTLVTRYLQLSLTSTYAELSLTAPGDCELASVLLTLRETTNPAAQGPSDLYFYPGSSASVLTAAAKCFAMIQFTDIMTAAPASLGSPFANLLVPLFGIKVPRNTLLTIGGATNSGQTSFAQAVLLIAIVS